MSDNRANKLAIFKNKSTAVGRNTIGHITSTPPSMKREKSVEPLRPRKSTTKLMFKPGQTDVSLNFGSFASKDRTFSELAGGKNKDHSKDNRRKHNARNVQAQQKVRIWGPSSNITTNFFQEKHDINLEDSPIYKHSPFLNKDLLPIERKINRRRISSMKQNSAMLKSTVIERTSSIGLLETP